MQAEIARVLRPDGRVGVSDLVGHDEADPDQQVQSAAIVGALNGVLSASAYRAKLEDAGLTDVTVTFTHEVAPSLSSALIQASRP